MRVIQARHFYPSRRQQVTKIGVHVTDTPAWPRSTAYGVGRYLSTVDRAASAHEGCDAAETVRYVDPDHTAFGIAKLNSPAWHLEIVCKPDELDGWQTKPNLVATLENAAERAAWASRRWGIPLRILDGADIFAPTIRGFVPHSAADTVRGDRTPHSDPGRFFPWGWWFDRIRLHLDEKEHTDTMPRDPKRFAGALERPDGKGYWFLLADGSVKTVNLIGEDDFTGPFYGSFWSLPEEHRVGEHPFDNGAILPFGKGYVLIDDHGHPYHFGGR